MLFWFLWCQLYPIALDQLERYSWARIWMMAQVGGLVDSLKKIGASASATRAAMLWSGSRSRVWHVAGSSRVWNGIFHLTPLMCCYQGWGPSRKWTNIRALPHSIHLSSWSAYTLHSRVAFLVNSAVTINTPVQSPPERHQPTLIHPGSSFWAEESNQWDG